ncbi:MAG: hypothetical protein FJY97_19105 [candidate division Zixibacteria bacterium]|nr:hypothetical protein [candidate division Zixibacteria bacterium]
MRHIGWMTAGTIAVAVLFPRWNTGAETPSAAVNTCVTCHAGLDDEKMSEPVAEWHRSVHKPAGISCQDCHGGNPTASVKELAHDPNAKYVGVPEPVTVHETCGICHQVEKDNYVASPHGLQGNFWPGCVDCHGNHEIKYPVTAAIAVPDKCDDCHDQPVLDAFIAGVDKGLKPLSDIRRDVEALRPSGVPIDEILSQAALAEDAFDRQASHTFNLSQVHGVADSLQKGYERLRKQEAAARTESDVRRRFGWVFAMLFVVMAGIIYLYRRSLPDE